MGFTNYKKFNNTIIFKCSKCINILCSLWNRSCNNLYYKIAPILKIVSCKCITLNFVFCILKMSALKEFNLLLNSIEQLIGISSLLKLFRDTIIWSFFGYLVKV